MKKLLKNVIRPMGFDVIKFDPLTNPYARRARLLDLYKVDLILDVGANDGRYVNFLRSEVGHTGKIISFEPVTAAFEKLTDAAQNDPNWEIHNFGFGDRDETRVINVAKNLVSSSILEMLPAHVENDPESRYIDKEEITLKRLDSVLDDVRGDAANLYLKIDTQGFEKNVLEGAESSLPSIATIQLEMSLTPLYEGEPLFHEISAYLYERGYRMVSVEAGTIDRTTCELYQFDGIFHRSAD